MLVRYTATLEADRAKYFVQELSSTEPFKDTTLSTLPILDRKIQIIISADSISNKLKLDMIFSTVGALYHWHSFFEREIVLRDLVGEKVTLVELPDGYDSELSQVKIGKKYFVKDISGSNLMIILPNGNTEFIHYGRFLECQ